MIETSDIRIGYLKILDHLLMGGTEEKSVSTGANDSGTPLKRPADEIEAVVFNSWAGIKDALCRGDIQGGFLPLPEAMLLFNSGLDIKVLLFDCRPGTMVVRNRAAGVAKLKDFKGKTILISSLHSVHFLLFYRLMRSVGLRTNMENYGPTDVFIDIVPPFMIPEMISCDRDGDIGGCIVEEPFASRIIYEGYGKKICQSGMLWPDHPHTALVIRDQVIQNNPISVLNLVTRMAVCNQSLYRDSRDLHLLINAFFDRDVEILEEILRSVLPAESISLIPDIKLLEIINDFMVAEMGLLNKMISMDEFVDLRFALEAGA